MNTKITVAAVGLAALTVGGLGVGTAFASGTTPATPAAATAETDNTQQGPDVQQGDQNAPDVAGAESDAAPARPSAVAPAANTQQLTVAAPQVTASKTATAQKNTPEAADTESADGGSAGSETTGASDGPGGHADQGNVDHQFEGNE